MRDDEHGSMLILHCHHRLIRLSKKVRGVHVKMKGMVVVGVIQLLHLSPNKFVRSYVLQCGEVFCSVFLCSEIKF